jgi:hypothetical protein
MASGFPSSSQNRSISPSRQVARVKYRLGILGVRMTVNRRLRPSAYYAPWQPRRSVAPFERKHMGSGVYRCGLCNPSRSRRPRTSPMSASRWTATSRRWCSNTCLPKTSVPTYGKEAAVDLGVLRTKRAALQAKLNDLAAMFGSAANCAAVQPICTSSLPASTRFSPMLSAPARRPALLADDTQTLTERWARGLPGHPGQGRQRADDRDRNARPAWLTHLRSVHGRNTLVLNR